MILQTPKWLPEQDSYCHFLEKSIALKRKKKKEYPNPKRTRTLERCVCLPWLNLLSCLITLIFYFFIHWTLFSQMDHILTATVKIRKADGRGRHVGPKGIFFIYLMKNHVWNYLHFKYRKGCDTMNTASPDPPVSSTFYPSEMLRLSRLGCLLSPALLIRSCSKAPSVNRIFLNREFTSPRLHGYFRRI